MKILVSACLLGENTRYDGGHCRHEALIAYLRDKEYIAVCPEVLGGLSIPRLPSELVKDRVLSSTGEDVTAAFIAGANKTLEVALANGCSLAILKSLSPSCGLGLIFDGNFSGNLVAGKGITAQILQEQGITVVNEDFVE